eukprot:579968-Amphidinium_carterae.1
MCWHFVGLLVSFAHPSCSQDVEWAKRTKSRSTGLETPVETRCQECFHMWSVAFQHLSWENFAAQVQPGSDMEAKIREVKGHLLAPATKSFVPARVCSEQSFKVELSQTYKALSEKQVKDLIGTSHLSKSVLKTLTGLEVASADGQKEMVFLFGHEDHPYRECKISKVTSGVMSREQCEPNRQWYAAQSGDVLQSAFVEAAVTDNLQSLVGLQQLPCLRDVINDRAEEKIPKPVIDEQSMLEKGNESEESDEDIVGIAAEGGLGKC